jgi:hypothetical protein
VSLADQQILSFDWGEVESVDPNHLVIGVDITDHIANGNRTSTIQLKLNEDQKSILGHFDIGYPFMAEAIAADVKQNNTTNSSTDLIQQNTNLYNKLTEAEKAFVKNPLNWSVAQKFQEDAAFAFNTAVNIFKFGEPQSLKNGRGDAFRHAFWSALLVKDSNVNKALEYLNAHEENSSQPIDEKLMDQHNNAAGIRIATENPTASVADLVSKIMAALDDGELTWIS